MPVLKYTCPECGVSLKPSKPLPEGKKVRCPKCKGVFLPEPEWEEEAPAQRAKPGGGRRQSEEELYQFKEEAEEEQGKKKREEALEPVKDNRPKSSRGPALAICQKPSNQMLFTSSLVCLNSIVSIIVLVWPMVFSKEPLGALDMTYAWFCIGGAALAFLYNATIAFGAVKMQNVESYAWGMIASILMLLPFNGMLAFFSYQWLVMLTGSCGAMAIVFVKYIWYLYIGIWNIVTLRNAEVIAGFSEKPLRDF